MWRREHTGTEHAAINCNYIVLAGNYADVVLKNLAEHAKPRIGVNEVDSELTTMSNQFITVRPVKLVAEKFYDDLNENSIVNHQVLQREEDLKQLQVVIRDFKNAEVYIAVDALCHYRDDLLVDAFLSCIHDGFQPQEFLLGTQLTGPHPTKKDKSSEFVYTGIYQTLAVTPVTIQLYSMGPKFKMSDVTYMPHEIHEAFKGARLDPDKKKEKYESKRKKRNKAIVDIEEDLDDWGQKLHHYRTGCFGIPEDSPGRQSSIFNDVRAALAKLEAKHDRADLHNAANAADPSKQVTVVNERCLLLDYPRELQQAEDDRLRRVKEAKDFEAQAKRRHELFLAQKAAYAKTPRAQREGLPAPAEITAADFKAGGRFSTYDRKQEQTLLLTGAAPATAAAIAAGAPVMSNAMVLVSAVGAELQDGPSKIAQERRAARLRAAPRFEPTAGSYTAPSSSAVAGATGSGASEPPTPPVTREKRSHPSGSDEDDATRGAFGQSSSSFGLDEDIEVLPQQHQPASAPKKAKGSKKQVRYSKSSALVLEHSLSGFD